MLSDMQRHAIKLSLADNEVCSAVPESEATLQRDTLPNGGASSYIPADLLGLSSKYGYCQY